MPRPRRQPPQQAARADRPPLSMRAASLQVVRRLQQAGYVAYFAGGCVRDMLRGVRPDDYDVATSAEPSQVVALFRRTQQVGAKFGVVLVRVGRHAIEVATFRTDADYADGRRPTAVHFTDARHDAQRRDFTINGMFYDPLQREVIDYVEGRADLKRRVVRAIGEPVRRFAEDHLRLMRAVRFAARLGFEIDSPTWAAMRRHAADIRRISPERIRAEMEMMFEHATRARAFDLLHASGLLRHLWPLAGALQGSEPLITQWLTALSDAASFELCMAIMMHPLDRAAVGKSCDALRCSNDTRRKVIWLHEHQAALDVPERLTLADLKMLMAHESFGDLTRLLAGKLRAMGLPMSPHRRIVSRARAIAPQEVSPRPLLTGDDLARLEVPRGPIYKRILDRVYYAQLNEEIADRAAARKLAMELLGRN